MHNFFSKFLDLSQLILIFSVISISLILSFVYKYFVPKLSLKDKSIIKKIFISIANIFREYIFFFSVLLLFSLNYEIKLFKLDNNVMINVLQTVVALYLSNKIINIVLESNTQKKISKSIFFPIIAIYFMDFLPDVSKALHSISFKIGTLKLSLAIIIKTLVLCYLLFWVFKIFNEKGKLLIKSKKDLDSRTRELIIKIYEILLFVTFILMLLELLGIDFTTLAIFSGALGVGIGFGLQSIASNFISGVILLFDRSITIGDHVELEDGKQGIVRDLKMRCATITTYEGKDILVPNEKFITNNLINWTHKDNEQRYSIKLQVSYKTNLRELFELLRNKIAEHPQVISGDGIPVEKRPDAEISNFCDSGVEILIEFWMQGIDDGENRVGADLLLMIWDVLHENNIQIPYPQREIRILNENSNFT